VARALARSAGVPTPAIRWDLSDGPWFDNQLGVLTIDGPRLDVTLAKAPPGDPGSPQLEQVLERNLTRG
jgi:hypothetical protein